MGSVSPLVGIYEELKNRDANLEALWLGTKTGPEKEFIAGYQIPFKAIVAGKLRQYFILANLFTPLFVFLGICQAFFILRKFKPAVVLTAGSFVAVPVVYAAKFFKIPIFVHQQDLEIGLANKLMARKATAITIVFKDLLGQFDYKKTFYTSNPVRKEIFQGAREKALPYFKLDSNLKTILIFGGGTGAQIINQIVLETIGKLTEDYQVIHLTGTGKGISEELPNYYDHITLNRLEQRYRAYEFLNNEIFDAMNLADLVISRAGFSSLTELAVLGKPVILIPLPGHQELNARYFAKYNAVKILFQNKLNNENFLAIIQSLMKNPADLQTLSRNILQMIDKDAAKNYADLICQVLAQ